MRPDQFSRLQDIEERLTDVFMNEADPDQWPGGSAPSAQLDPEQRKERYLWKRAATETAMLLVRTQSLMTGTKDGQDLSEYDMDQQIRMREKQAKDMLDKAMKKARTAVANASKPPAS